MSTKMIKSEISNLFKREVEKVFSKDVLFAFLCGGYAKNKLNKNSDVDIFICIKKRNKTKESKFRTWYLLLHKKMGLKPDKFFYYEIVDPKTLWLSINKASVASPQVKIPSRVIYDGIVWSGMLSDKHKNFIGNHGSYLKFRKRAKVVVTTWRGIIMKKLKSLPPDQFLKLTTSYGDPRN